MKSRWYSLAVVAGLALAIPGSTAQASVSKSPNRAWKPVMEKCVMPASTLAPAMPTGATKAALVPSIECDLAWAMANQAYAEVANANVHLRVAYLAWESCYIYCVNNSLDPETQCESSWYEVTYWQNEVEYWEQTFFGLASFASYVCDIFGWGWT